uniref:Uncharacterized protein n=1 Tax=viral metagenome TaxID=1070528 RepID=A0A6C0EJB3_9ZZZZ
MSAGGLSYHGVVGHTAKATLPSVETWGANMNILRDGPKSITTRKIDRVGQTSEITQMIQESGDRATDAIKVYARGVNPMVAVSYGNYGTNGGQRIGGTNVTSRGQGNSGTQAFLPYRIMDGGAFRPPARGQRDLLPLSRLPRVWTSSFTQPGFADFSKKAMCPGTAEDTKGVKTDAEMLRACARPNATYKIETPVVEPFEVRYVIKNPTQVEGYSGIKPQAIVQVQMGDVTQQILNEPLHAQAEANFGTRRMQKNIELSHFDTEKYTHDALIAPADSNLSRNIQVTSIDELFNVDTSGMIKEPMNISHTVHQTGYNKYNFIHDDPELERRLPQHQARTNIGQNIYKQVADRVQERNYVPNRPFAFATSNPGVRDRQAIDEITSRDYNLKPTVNPGGYMPNQGRPAIDYNQGLPQFDLERSQLRQRVYEMQQGRY